VGDTTVDRKKMHRDNWLSVLIGPFKFVVPTLSYIILYPLMISETSIEVVGLWSLTAAIVSFISVTDIGFSQLLVRDAGTDRAKYFSETYVDYVTAQRFYMLLLLALIFVVIITQEYIFAPVAEVYSTSALAVSVILILIGAFIQLTGKLDAAILSARHDNYIVQLVTGVAPVLTYSAMIIGALLKRPIEGLAIGTVLTGVATVMVYRFRLHHHHNEFVSATNTLNLHDTVRRFFPLVRRGWHLYSCSVGLMLRGPIYRLIIVTTIGLQAAAIFDIAMRVTQTVREVIATGFSVLFPSFSILYRNGERARIIELIQISLMVLLSLGTLSLCLLMAAIAPILSLWLGSPPPETLPSTRVLAIWQIITLANVPFWHLLQASHNERVAAYSVWAHTALIILLIPLSSIFNVGIVDLLMYWTVTSVFTQGLIYYHVQKKLALLWDSIKSTRILALLALIVVFSALSYLISPNILEMGDIIGYFGLAAVIFTLAAAIIIVKPVMRFLKAENG
jgi:O-antigen/teichoic acid export membrane protein